MWSQTFQYTKEAKRNIIESRNKYIYAAMKEGDIVCVSPNMHNMANQLKCSTVTVMDCINNRRELRDGIYIARYEKGSEQHSELWLMLHPDTKQR
ncbi:hypothetical protein D3C78_1773120 [compost metagenome]